MQDPSIHSSHALTVKCRKCQMKTNLLYLLMEKILETLLHLMICHPLLLHPFHGHSSQLSQELEIDMQIRVPNLFVCEKMETLTHTIQRWKITSVDLRIMKRGQWLKCARKVDFWKVPQARVFQLLPSGHRLPT